MLGQAAMKRIEGGRESLRFFVAGGIFVKAGIESQIEDKPTWRTKSQDDIALGIAQCHFAAWHEQNTVRRNVFDLVKNRHPGLAAAWTKVFSLVWQVKTIGG